MKTFNNIKSTNRYYYSTTETDKEDNRIYLHRKLVEEHIGRKLLNHEHVHHLDFDKSHNAFSNLLLCDRSSHIKLHNIIKSFTLTSKEEGHKTFAEIIQPTKETVELLLGRQLLNDEEYYSFVDNPEYLNISKIIIIHKAFKSNLLRWLGQYKLEFKENTELWFIDQLTKNTGVNSCPICEVKIRPEKKFCSVQCKGVYDRRSTTYAKINSAEKTLSANRQEPLPSKEQLKLDITSMPMIDVGKKYGVTDNSVRRWCKKYGLSPHSRDYSDTIKYSFNKPVLAMHYFTHEVKRFVSLVKCSKFFGIGSKRLSEVLKSKDKFYWQKDEHIFKYEDDSTPWYCHPFNTLKVIGQLKPIELVAIEGDTCSIYPSLASCAKAYGFPEMTIFNAIKTRGSFTRNGITIYKLNDHLNRIK